MPNINEFERLFRRSISHISDGSATVRLQLDRIKPAHALVLTHVSVENRTNDYDKCRLGIRNQGRDFYVDELQVITANELAVARSDLLLGENDIFFAELSGTTANDNLVMCCIGWEKRL